MSHPTDLLAAYAMRELPPDTVAALERHLADCPDCRRDLTAWRHLATGVQIATATTPPPPAVFAVIRRRVNIAPRIPVYAGQVAGHPLRRMAALLPWQWWLVRWPVWVTAGVVLILGTVIAALSPFSAEVMAMLVPLITAATVAASCGADTDPAGELTRATLTSPRTVLLARLTTVLSTMTVASLAASLALTLPDGARDGFALVGAWLGPLVPLCALSFALSVLWRTSVGVGAALTLWSLRPLSGTDLVGDWITVPVERIWTPDTAVILIAVALVAASCYLAPLRPLRRSRSV